MAAELSIVQVLVVQMYDDECVLQFQSRILDLGRIPYVGFRFHLEFQNLASFLKSIHVVQSKRRNVPNCLTGVDEMHMNNSLFISSMSTTWFWTFSTKQNFVWNGCLINVQQMAAQTARNTEAEEEEQQNFVQNVAKIHFFF